MGSGIHGAQRHDNRGDHDLTDDGPAPGVSSRTGRLPPSRRQPTAAGLDGARRSIQHLDQLADQLADAIARRDFHRARALASSIESVRTSLAPVLATAVRAGADPDAIAALEAEAAPLSDRLDTLIPQAPEPLPGLGVDLASPATDAAREAVWLRALGATAPRSGDPFGAARFAAAALGDVAPHPHGHVIDAVSTSAKVGTANGTTDEPLIGWSDVKHAALSGPFFAAPRRVQDALTGPLFSLLRKRETIHFLLDPTGSDPVNGPIADVLGDLANDPEYTIGFAEGAITGTISAVYDTLKGFYDTGKLVVEILSKLATYQYRALLARGRKAIDDLIALVENAPGLLKEFARRWRTPDSYARGEFQGEVIAYIATQLAIIIAGSLAGPAIVAAGPYAELIIALRWLDNPIAEIVDLARGAKLSASALEALHAGSAGRGIRSIDPVAETRAASGMFDGLDDLDGASMRRPMATADELVHAARLAALDEIAKIQIVPLRKGAAPGIDLDALYVSHADGARLPQLLRTIKPDIEIKPYGKGLLVRNGADEWWIQFNDRAATLSAERATGIDAARGGIGLPESNVATVEIWGFLGQKKKRSWTPEQFATYDDAIKGQRLLWAGHVGITWDGGKTIYGFTPMPAKPIEPEKLVERLKKHEAFPGRLADDTEAFNDAQRMVDENGWDTRIEKTVVLLDKRQRSELMARVMEMKGMKPGAHGFGYGFPLDEAQGGQHFAASNGYDADHVRNCATLPEKLGLPIPEQSGQMIRYMPELEKWAAADAPIDARPPPTSAPSAPPGKEPKP